MVRKLDIPRKSSRQPERLPFSHVLKIGLVLASSAVAIWFFAFHQWRAILAEQFLQPLAHPQYDFVVFYAAADGIEHGGNIYDLRYLTDLMLPVIRSYPTSTLPPYLYPPLFAVLLRPLTLLSPQGAQIVWFVVSQVAYWLTILILWRGCRESARPWLFLPVVTLAVTFQPTQEAFRMGQVDILLLFLIAISLHALTREQPWRSSFGLALATVVKVAPLPLLVFAAYRRPSLRLPGGLLFCLFLAIGLVTAGAHLNVLYFTAVLPSLSEPIPWLSNQALGGFVGRLWEPGTAGRVQAVSLTIAKGLTALLAIPFVGLAAAVCLPRRYRQPSSYLLRLQFGLLIPLILMCSSPAWYARLSWMVLPFVVALDAAIALPSRPTRITGLALLAVSFLLVQVWPFLEQLGISADADFASRQLLSTPLFGLIILFGLLCWLTRRTQTRVQRPEHYPNQVDSAVAHQTK